MLKKNVLEAEREAKRFLSKVKELKEAISPLKNDDYIWGCKESAAVRRASMDLSRALSKMRQERY